MFTGEGAGGSGKQHSGHATDTIIYDVVGFSGRTVDLELL